MQQELINKQRERFELEFKMKHKDGHWVDILSRATAIFNEQGTAIRVVGTHVDISERKKLEAALLERERELLEAQRLAQIGSWTYNLETMQPEWSEEIFRIWGLDPEKDTPDYEEHSRYIHPDDFPGFAAAAQRALQHGTPYELELRVVRPDGQIRVIITICEPVFGEDGTLKGLRGTVQDITERKRIVEKLKASEKTYRQLVESMQETLSVITSEGTFRFANSRAAANLTDGGAPDILIGKNIRDLIPAEQADRLMEQYQKVITDGAPLTQEIKVSMPKGDKWFRSSFTPITYGAEEEKCILSLSQDITEQKHATFEKERQAKHLQNVLEATTDGIWEWNLSTETMSFSSKYYTMLGYEPGEFPSSFESWFDLLHPEDRESTQRIANEWLESMDGMYENSFRMRTKQGEYRWIETKAKVVEYDSSGNPEVLVGNHVDITKKRKAEQELLQAHRRLSFHVENSPLAVIEWEKGTHIKFWSKQAENIFGWKAEEVTGKSWSDFEFIHPDDQEDAGKQIARLFKGTDAFNTIANRNFKKDKSVVYCQWYNSPLRDDNGKMISILSQVADVTELKKFEQNLLSAKKQSEAANKAKSEFLANMSHEIRTPMNGVLGMLQLLQTTNIDEEQKEYVLTAIQSSKRLTRLLADILDLSKVEANRMSIQSSPLHLVDVVEQTCELFKPIAQQTQVKLVCHVAPNIPSSLTGDSVRLQQVLTNIIGNAFKFTREGHISVEAYPITTSDLNKYQVLFSITDTGIGIPDDKVEKLFQPFSQVSEGYRRDHQGAGLGLSICRKLIKLMGGNISIESETGEGTTVHFCVTFCVDEPVMKPEVSAPASGRSMSLRILLAEDEDVNRLSTKKLMEKHGHKVCCVVNGQEVISLLKDDSFDVILMDIQMPVMDGVEATKRIRKGEAGEKHKNIPIIAMTAYAMSGDKEKFLEADMNDYIAKPVDLEELEALLQNVFKEVAPENWTTRRRI